jgi:NADP-dependent 3-hydroxy acid dehydrogenase YdfG
MAPSDRDRAVLLITGAGSGIGSSSRRGAATRRLEAERMFTFTAPD